VPRHLPKIIHTREGFCFRSVSGHKLYWDGEKLIKQHGAPITEQDREDVIRLLAQERRRYHLSESLINKNSYELDKETFMIKLIH